MSFVDLQKVFGFMLEASVETLKLFAITILLGLPLGLLACMGRMSKSFIIRNIVKFYLLIMRGTPLILQLMFWKYGPAYLFELNLDIFTAATLAFVFNYAAYFAEIYRSGIESIPVGQKEAATVLGFSRTQVFFKIVLPQVVKRILPPMSNEFMTLVKDTSLAQVIGYAEIYQLATSKMSFYVNISPLVMAGVFYLVMNLVVSRAFAMAEKKYSYYR